MSTAAVTVLLGQLEEARREYDLATAAGSQAIADGLRAQERVEVQSVRIQELERAIALLRAAEEQGTEEPTP